MMPLVSARSLRALDYVNFLIADVQTGFGPFVAVYLAANKWTQGEIGIALSIGTIAALAGQVPAGALVDWMRNKRLAAAIGIASVCSAALLLALFPIQLPVYVAALLQGLASSMLTPAIAAVSLALVGHAAFGEQLGRNARFASIGNGLAAAVMGVIGSYVAPGAVFWLTALLGVPALAALSAIGRVDPVEHAERKDPFDWAGLRELITDHRLIAFAACALLFHLSNAAMLPLAAAAITKSAGHLADLIVGACIVGPQVGVALLSPWVGRSAASYGRRPWLLLGWAMLFVRGVLIAFAPDSWSMIAIQSLSGISGAVFGVMLPLVCADLTIGSGRFNLCLGLVSLAVYVGASLSTTLAGWAADQFGDMAAFIALALVGLAGTAMVGLVMPETRPTRQASRRRLKVPA